MNFTGSPPVMGVSFAAREVTGRRPGASGMSLNCSVHVVGAEGSVGMAVLFLSCVDGRVR